jgi:hypothetical protein
MKVLPAHPKIDGIVNQARDYGVVQAFLKDQGLRGISVGDPPTLGAYALKVAVDVLDGHPPATRP